MKPILFAQVSSLSSLTYVPAVSPNLNSFSLGHLLGSPRHALLLLSMSNVVVLMRSTGHDIHLIEATSWYRIVFISLFVHSCVILSVFIRYIIPTNTFTRQVVE